MATEILAVPEQHLKDVIRVIRLGLQGIEKIGVEFGNEVKPEVIEQLTKWCNEEEVYLERR